MTRGVLVSLISLALFSCKEEDTSERIYRRALAHERIGNSDSAIILLRSLALNSDSEKFSKYNEAIARLQDLENRRGIELYENAKRLHERAQYHEELSALQALQSKYLVWTLRDSVLNRIADVEEHLRRFDDFARQGDTDFAAHDYAKARDVYLKAAQVMRTESIQRKIDSCEARLSGGYRIGDRVFVLESIRLTLPNGRLRGYSHFIYHGTVIEKVQAVQACKIRIARIQRWWEDIGLGTMFGTEGPRESHITAMPFTDEHGATFESRLGSFSVPAIVEVSNEELCPSETEIAQKLPQRFRRDLVSFVSKVIL